MEEISEVVISASLLPVSPSVASFRGLMMIELCWAICQPAASTPLHRALWRRVEAVGWDRSCLSQILLGCLTCRLYPVKFPGVEEVLRKAVRLCCGPSGKEGQDPASVMSQGDDGVAWYLNLSFFL